MSGYGARIALAWVALLVGLVACQRPTASAAGKAAASTSASSAVPSRLSPGAFDLSSADDGAALVVADASHGGLSLTLFDAAGRTRRTGPLYDAEAPSATRDEIEISEVATATLGARIAVTWLEKSATTAHARAIVRPLAQQAGASLSDLGEMAEPVSSPRGNLGLGMSDGRFLVLTRAQKTNCVDSNQSDCVGFDFIRLEPDGNSRPGPPLAVPLPCEQNSVSFAVSGGRWYYGVCSRSTGKPVTTLFSIQSEPAYARADRILEGCLPLGASAVDGDLIVIGDCGGTRRGVRVRGGNAEVEEVRVDRVDAVCQDGKPQLRQLGPGGLNLVLDQRRDRVEAFLPASFAPPQARAVWTGQTLLVASSSGTSVILKGYRCDSTLLREVALK